MSLIPGTRLGAYEVVAPLGTGGMGAVYRARDLRLQRDVAVKVLGNATASNPDNLARFEQEARATVALNHPNILAVFDIGSYDGQPFLVSEVLEGEPLRDLLRSGPLPMRKAVDYAAQIATGLAAAHDKGIVHRDLKPENVFITSEGRAKILDFGIAKLMAAPRRPRHWQPPHHRARLLAPCWARRPTWRPSKSAGARSIIAPTSSHLAPRSLRC